MPFRCEEKEKKKEEIYLIEKEERGEERKVVKNRVGYFSLWIFHQDFHQHFTMNSRNIPSDKVRFLLFIIMNYLLM